jgi:hypothetical protein
VSAAELVESGGMSRYGLPDFSIAKLSKLHILKVLHKYEMQENFWSLVTLIQDANQALPINLTLLTLLFLLLQKQNIFKITYSLSQK